jgi:hypothetical protein
MLRNFTKQELPTGPCPRCRALVAPAPSRPVRKAPGLSMEHPITLSAGLAGACGTVLLGLTAPATQSLKQELGLGHFEGRGWRGFHHLATLCIAAYGFLIAERGAIPPSAPRNTSFVAVSSLPNGFRPGGAPDPA